MKSVVAKGSARLLDKVKTSNAEALKQFQNDMEKRLSSVNACDIPDFGIHQQNNLFEEMAHYYIDDDG